MPTDNGIRKQLLLVKNTELKEQVCVQRGNVERRCVIDRVNVRLRCVHLIESDDTKRREDRPHRELRPEAGERVQNAAVFVEESEGNRGDAEQNCDKPDQRVEIQIGSQSAEHAIFLAHGRFQSSTILWLTLLHNISAIP